MTEPAPAFSVVIPVYNRAAQIRPSLKSVQAQTLPDFECLVVDDGSDDGAALAQAVADLADRRFVYVRRENGGGGAARNTGIALARGRYVAFLDSDDMFLPNKLERMAAHIPDDPAAAWYSLASVNRGGHARWVKPSRAIGLDEDVGEYLFSSNEVISTITLVVQTAVARHVKFDPELRKGQDLDFCIRLQANGVRFRMIPEILSVWNDTTETGRASRTAGYAQPMAWLAANQHRLTSRAIAGYRANVLAYYAAPDRPMLAASYLARGLVAGVPPRVIARQVLRCFLPRGLYRRLVDGFVSVFGRR